VKKISLYNNAYSKFGQTVLLDEVLFGDKYKKQVEAIRREKNSKKNQAAKLQMPMYTVSGVFSHRSKNGLLEHSGMICLDIDGKDNTGIDLSLFIASMKHVDQVYYAGRSISGNGAFIIVSISNPEQHEQHFDALVVDFERMGIKVDKSCRDVSRARFVSRDPHPYHNPKAKAYDKILVPEFKNRVYHTDTNNNIDKLVKKAIDTGTNITQSYSDWFALACSLRNVPGGRDIYHKLSAMDSRYNEARTEYQFDAVSGGSGYDERKFFEICKRHGITLK